METLPNAPFPLFAPTKRRRVTSQYHSCALKPAVSEHHIAGSTLPPLFDIPIRTDKTIPCIGKSPSFPLFCRQKITTSHIPEHSGSTTSVPLTSGERASHRGLDPISPNPPSPTSHYIEKHPSIALELHHDASKTRFLPREKYDVVIHLSLIHI